MHDDTIQLRQPTGDTETLRAFTRPIAAAFGDDYTDAMFEVDRQAWELERLIGALDGATWVGGGSADSVRLTVPGGAEVRAAAITGVGVSPTHQRRGILTRIMRWLMDQAADRGEPLAVLHASEGAIYPRFGFGLGTLQGTVDIERAHFRFATPAEPLGRVRFVELDGAMHLIPPIYDRIRVGRVGEISRSPAAWRLKYLGDEPWRRSSAGPKFNAVLDVEGEVRGYVVYRLKEDWDDRGSRSVLTVLELTGLDVAAERALWEWVAGIDLVGRIKAWRAPVANPLFLQLADFRRMGLVVGDGIWVRLIDLPAALTARSYAGDGRVTLDVTDSFCPANAGRWTLQVASDRATVSGVDPDAAPDLALDTADLATVYLGAFSFADLARAGRVRECRDGALVAADRLFATAEAPWCSTMF